MKQSLTETDDDRREIEAEKDEKEKATEKEWQEKELFETKVRDQKNFYGELTRRLKNDELSPGQVREYENVDKKDPKEVASLSERSFQLWEERNFLADELSKARQTKELETIGNTVADKILSKGQQELKKKLQIMGDGQRQSYEEQMKQLKTD